MGPEQPSTNSIFSWDWWHGNTRNEKLVEKEVTKVRGATYAFPGDMLREVNHHDGNENENGEKGMMSAEDGSLQHDENGLAQSQSQSERVMLQMTSAEAQAVIDEIKLQEQIGDIQRRISLSSNGEGGNGRRRSRSSSWGNRSNSRRSSTAMESSSNVVGGNGEKEGMKTSSSTSSISSMGKKLQTSTSKKSRGRAKSRANRQHIMAPMQSMQPVTNNFGDDDNNNDDESRSNSPRSSSSSRDGAEGRGHMAWSRNTSANNMCMNDDFGIVTSKREKFQQILQESDIDLDELRKMSWSGIPASLRGTVWKILLGHLPCNKARREKVLMRKRKEYLNFVSKYYDEKAMKKTEYENAVQRQVC